MKFKSTTSNRLCHWLLTGLALLCIFPALVAARPIEPQLAAAKPEPRTFAVSGFPVIGARSTDYSWLGVGLGDDLATRLARCDQHLFQVERLQFNEVLRAQRVEMLTQGVSETAEPDAAERQRLNDLAQATRTSFQGQKWGARYVIIGSLWLEGTYPQEHARLKANVRLVDVATGQIISGAQATSEGSETGYLRLQEQLAEQLAERLGVPAEQRVQVRDYRREGGEVYRRFVQAREALYQGRYQEAKTLSEQAETAGAHHLLPQIWETNRQAHERLVKGVSEKDKAYQLNRERRQQVEARKHEVQELAALAHFENGEQYRIEAETFERFGDGTVAKDGYQQALTAYDEYLRNTQNGLVRWEANVPGGIGDSQIVVTDELIYAASASDLFAFDAKTGSLRWNFYTSYEEIYTPVVVDGIVYAQSKKGHLRAFDAQTGVVRWDFQDRDWKAWSPAIRAIVVDEIAYMGSGSGHLRAFDAKTGVLRWDFQAGDGIYPPVVVDGIAYAGSKDGHLRAFDAKTGVLRWDFQAGDGIYPPVVVGEIAYAGSQDGHLRAFDAKTGVLRWDFQAKGRIYPPVVVGGIAYVGSQDGHLRAFDAQTGELRWDSQTGDKIDLRPVVVDGIVYVALSLRGGLRAFDAQTGTVRWNLHGYWINNLLVVDGLVYAGSEDGHLKVFNAQTGELRWDFKASIRAINIFNGPPIYVTEELIYVVQNDRLLAINRSVMQQAKTIPTVHKALTQKATVLAKLGQAAYALRVFGRKLRESERGSANDAQFLAALLPQLRLSPHVQEALNLRILGKTQMLLWDFQTVTEIGQPEVVDGVVYEGSLDGRLWAFDAKTGDLRWDFQARDGIDPPVVVNRIAYASGLGFVVSFDAKTGDLRWDFQTNSFNHLVVMDGVVYITSSNGHLRALDAKTGDLRWDFQADGIFDPLVVDGIAYVGSKDGYLRAFDTQTGALRWDFQADSWIYTPIVVNGIAYAGSWNRHLRAFDAQTGELRWDFKDGSWGTWSPVVVDGIAYAGSKDGHLRAFDAKTGELRWDSQAWGESSTPVVMDGIVYVSSSRRLRAYDAKTGKLRWDFQARDEIHTPVVVDGIAYAGSKSGHLRAFDAKTGALRWDFQARDEIHTPVVVDGIAYATSSDFHLRAFPVAQVTSGQYTPDVTWNSDEQFYSYLIWGKLGLAISKGVEKDGDVEDWLKQSGLSSKEEIIAKLCQLAAGIPYYSAGALAEDPGKLRPPWLTEWVLRDDKELCASTPAP
ncbi:MAG: PQQ-binding-like beta-propeller repeat protein [Candidatus Contendobacter sp.]|nr:PQQ-binding-like beta-propeller repeat protein [Candidatus Contendobacter sp.]